MKFGPRSGYVIAFWAGLALMLTGLALVGIGKWSDNILVTIEGFFLCAGGILVCGGVILVKWFENVAALAGRARRRMRRYMAPLRRDE